MFIWPKYDRLWKTVRLLCEERGEILEYVLNKIEEVVPEVHLTYRERINILRAVSQFGPIGRKMLADKVLMTERRLRSEAEILKEQLLLASSASGMVITPRGEEALRNAQKIFRELAKFEETEEILARTLGFKTAIVVEGDLEGDTSVYLQMAIELNHYLDETLPHGQHTLAVTGGTTIQAIVDHLPPYHLTHERQFVVASARGGMNEHSEYQSNHVSGQLANKLNGENIPLYVPETLKKDTVELLIQEPEIKENLAKLRQCNIFFFSVGEAESMALRRHLDSEVIQEIKDRQAIGEVLGCFFDKTGQIVYRVPRVGLQFEDLKHISYPILIAAGVKKAEAIRAFSVNAPKQTVLITDEATCHYILS